MLNTTVEQKFVYIKCKINSPHFTHFILKDVLNNASQFTKCNAAELIL